MVTVFKLVPAVDMRLGFFFFLTVHYSDHCCPPLVVGCGSAHKLARWPTFFFFLIWIDLRCCLLKRSHNRLAVRDADGVIGCGFDLHMISLIS